RLGVFYNQPFHWAISPYSDMTLGVQLHENVNPLGSIEYRKRFYSGDLVIQGSATYEQDFDGEGEPFGTETYRSHIFASGRFRINDYWRWGFGAERTSDDLYLRRYGIDGAGESRGPFLGDHHRLLSQLYVQGQDASSYATVNFLSFQGLREDDSPALLPNILPFGEYERVFNEPILDGQLRVRASTAVLDRSEEFVDTARASVGATWRGDYVVGPGWVVSPFAEGRLDAYRINDPILEEETFTRGVGMVGAEVSWPFVRPGENIDLLVEPIAVAAISVGENDPRIVNEDSIGFELDDSNLFRPNATPNFDLWETGERLSLGVRATARMAGGQSASLLFGRRWRSEDADEFGPETNLDGNATDYVGAATVDLGPQFGAQVRVRLEDDSFEVNRLDAGVRGALGRFSAQARYYSIDDSFYPDAPNAELSANVGYQLTRGWEVQYGVRRDLDSDINLSQDWRAIYRDDCSFLELSYSRSETFDRTLGPNEGFQIRIGLTSLGVFGGGD
ncbi:MAG: LPS-assembly protein LptD, partial [Hyphomonadaceae bacterium]